MGLASAGALALGTRAGAAPGFHLGLVTYNVAKDWDLDTILRLVPEAGFEGVEFRTTHAHGVERIAEPGPRGPRCGRGAPTRACGRRASGPSASSTRPTRRW